MRKIIVNTNWESFEAYLIQFIVNTNNSIIAIIELNDGSIKSYRIHDIKFKYPMEE